MLFLRSESDTSRASQCSQIDEKIRRIVQSFGMRWSLAIAASLSVFWAGQPAQAATGVRAQHGMVVTREAHATEAAVSILKAGGNAVDAAVAAGFALAVTHPSAGNLGGGGFMLIRMADGRTAFIDFREAAPGHASRDMYLDRDGRPTRASLDGWRAPGVPGTVRGFELASKKYGRKRWADLIAPAIGLAGKGLRKRRPRACSTAPRRWSRTKIRGASF
jgi:gamma-glutamyltranspeptidase/glutathione hydrolase